jgi:hypothetical protein
LLAAASLFVAATLFRRERRFTLNAAHFAERHGLIILIALGESVIAIAMGASACNPAVKGQWLFGVVLSLVLVASLCWSYFDREDRRAADSIGRGLARRALAGLRSASGAAPAVPARAADAAGPSADPARLARLPGVAAIRRERLLFEKPVLLSHQALNVGEYGLVDRTLCY